MTGCCRGTQGPSGPTPTPIGGVATTTGGRPAEGDGKPTGKAAGINRLVSGVGEYLMIITNI